MKKITLIIICTLSLFLFGCPSQETIDSSVGRQNLEKAIESQENATESIDTSTNLLEEETNTIDKETKNIDEESDKINNNTKKLNNNLEKVKQELKDKDIFDYVKNHISSITESVVSIQKSNQFIKKSVLKIQEQKNLLISLSQNLQSSSLILKDSLEDYKNLENKISKQDEQIQELEKDLESASTKYLGMLVALGVILMIIGGLGFMWSPRVGIVTLGIGALTTGIAAAVINYFGYFAIAGLSIVGVGFLAMIGYIGYLFVKGKHFEKATEENIELLEIAKQEMPELTKKNIFGDSARPGIASFQQSPSTQKIVQKVREKKLKPKMEHTIPNIETRETLVRDGKYYIGITEKEAKDIFKNKK